MDELLPLLFPIEGFADSIKNIPAQVFDFKSYTTMTYVAVSLALLLLAGGLLFGFKLAKDHFSERKKCGILLIITAFLCSPIIFLSMAGFLGDLKWTASLIMIIFYLVCQCIVDYEQVGMNSLFGIGVAIFGCLGLLLATPNLNTENEIMDAMMQYYSATIPCGAVVSSVAGIIKNLLEYSPSSLSTYSSYTAPSSSTGSGYTNLFDAREDLKNKLNNSSLSQAEKEALVKEHNDKYIDHISVKDGQYYNFSDD